MKKKWPVIGGVVLALILILVVALFFFLRHLATSGRPIYDGQVLIPGMKEEVEVIRDEQAVPHIYARNEDDLYRATGYVMAQDRLWQMDLLRRVATGRLAEIFGSSLVETDLLLRALRIPEKAHQVLAATPASIGRALEAFSEGVNAYLKEQERRLPLEFRLLRYKPEPWSPAHCAYLIGYMGWDLAFAWHIESIVWQLQEKVREEKKLAELFPGPPYQGPLVYPGFDLPSAIRGDIGIRNPSLFHPSSAGEKGRLLQAQKSFLLLSPSNFSIRFTPWENTPWAKSLAFLYNWDGALYPKQNKGDIFPPHPSSLLGAVSPLEELGLTIFAGSNNWAVSPEKSATGQPLLANDMHLAFSLPGIWYPLHQSVEGTLHVCGVALPGEPFVVAGHNEHIAWGMTNVMADDMDFYVETTDPANPDHYLFQGSWRPMEVRKETIKIRGSKQQTRTLRFTHRGAVISEFRGIKDKVISMRWTGNEESNELRGVYLLNRARNWGEFREAVSSFRSLSQNIIYADIYGHIGIQLAGGIPLRRAPGWALLSGETDAYDWQGLVPFEQLPFVFDPPEGYVFSANNRSVDDRYPYPISYFFLPPDRAERIQEVLSSRDKLGPEDFIRLQADGRSKFVTRLKPHLIDILENRSEWSELEKEAMQRLKAWDGEMEASSPEATIFESLYLELSRQLLGDELGEELLPRFFSAAGRVFLPAFLEQALGKKESAWADDITTPEVRETIHHIVARSFRATISQLKSRLGPEVDRWQWGRVHQLTLTHPLGRMKLLDWLFQLNRGPYQVGGSSHTVCPYGYSLSSPFIVNYGASQRHIYIPGKWDDSLTVIPGGVCGVPASPYYADQVPIYLQNKYRADVFSREAVARAARHRLIIKNKE